MLGIYNLWHASQRLTFVEASPISQNGRTNMTPSKGFTPSQIPSEVIRCFVLGVVVTKASYSGHAPRTDTLIIF